MKEIGGFYSAYYRGTKNDRQQISITVDQNGIAKATVHEQNTKIADWSAYYDKNFTWVIQSSGERFVFVPKENLIVFGEDSNHAIWREK